MPIADKTRKLLWASSGKRCAICGTVLIADATAEDDASVVGDECHIVSGSKSGPRHDPGFPKERLDSYENLILLCRVHHKLIDDQPLTFCAEKLRQMKTDHEIWVSERLGGDSKEQEPIRIRRRGGKGPLLLGRITRGRELLALVSGACGFGFDYDDPDSPEEVDLICGFLETAENTDVYPVEMSARVQLAFDIDGQISELEKAGFWVFGMRENQVLEGGMGEPSNWPVAYITVVRKTNEGIVNLEDGKAFG